MNILKSLMFVYSPFMVDGMPHPSLHYGLLLVARLCTFPSRRMCAWIVTKDFGWLGCNQGWWISSSLGLPLRWHGGGKLQRWKTSCCTPGIWTESKVMAVFSMVPDGSSMQFLQGGCYSLHGGPETAHRVHADASTLFAQSTGAADHSLRSP